MAVITYEVGVKLPNGKWPVLRIREVNASRNGRGATIGLVSQHDTIEKAQLACKAARDRST